MNLTAKQKRHLRTLSHNKKPLVIVGNHGLTTTVLSEIESTIAHHELIKIRINAEDKKSRVAMIDRICEALDCSLVFSIGHVATLYKENKKLPHSATQKIKLPRI